MAAAAVNNYLESLWASEGMQVSDTAGELALNLIVNISSSEQKAVLDALPVLIFLERAGKIVFANREARLFINEADANWQERPTEEVLWGLLTGTAEPQTRLKGTRRSRPFHATMPVTGNRMMPVEGSYSVVVNSPGDAVIVAQPSGIERAPKSNFMDDVLASLPEAVVIERRGHILYSNPAFTKMFGYSTEEVEGITMSELVMKQASPIENAALAGLLEDQGVERIEATIHGPVMNLDIQVAPLVVNGECAGRVFTFREVARQDGTGSWQLTEGLENRWGTSIVPFP